MLAINLLLSTSAQSEMAIAIAIVIAAAMSTMTVWLSTRNAVVTQAEAKDEG
jgi:mannose/fructose/N-acetylgalactosamine-specific phosphotransferase system component IIC